MGKHWARQQVKHDEVHDIVDRGIFWVSKNRQTAAMTGAAVALAGLIAAILVYQNRSARSAAWERLSLAQTYAYTGKLETAMEQLQKLLNEQPGSDAAGFGLVFEGDMLFQKGNYKGAIDDYTKAVERGQPRSLQPLALSDLALAQEANGQAQQAVATGQRFLELYSDHFLAPQVHACLARSLVAAGQPELAKSTLQKIQLQYPDTSWAAWAQSQLKGS